MKYTECVRFLRKNGYREVEELLQTADFSVKGDTILVWPVDQMMSWRLHFFDEEFEYAEMRQEDSWKKEKLLPTELPPNCIITEHGTIYPGDYIVHPFHGVGIFEYIISKKTLDGDYRLFISLQYAGNDRLLFPFERWKELMPYIGNRHPRLTRLNSKSWQHTKERIEKDLIQVARELLKMYADRHTSERPAYSFSTEWEKEIARGVSFELTEDQKRALTDIKNDLTKYPYPMDRLVCGDVGFGKTEVALRTAAQVMAAGKQVAFIAPTTILVEQHYTLLEKRFAHMPVQMAHLSRLTHGKEKEVLPKLAEGGIDIIVGTHRLLGKDIQFKDLGLLILDEEQKFGVAQKEWLKKIRPNIDVLSLSATPIPRTLSMSLSGLRGLSLLRTAPQGRLPIETTVVHYSDKVLAEALKAELARGGQVYVVHNRVQSLPAVLLKVEEMCKVAGFPEASVAMAHGQMDEVKLASTMSGFLGGEINVLVASSIVEHGLDSPGANTLVVLHSERFGLSDLYQLRGRVGRRQKQAFAHFLLGGIESSAHSAEIAAQFQLTETAKRRLDALLEADELGSGWSIAMRDLEIRGGGNILGNEQHGSMEAIGLLLYSQLLQEAIGRQARELKIPIFQYDREVDEVDRV